MAIDQNKSVRLAEPLGLMAALWIDPAIPDPMVRIVVQIVAIKFLPIEKAEVAPAVALAAMVNCTRKTNSLYSLALSCDA